MTITSTLGNALLSHVYRNQTYPSPASIYLGLLNSSGVELSGSGYARASVGSAFGAPVNGVSTTTANVTFPAPATADWAAAHFAAFYNASTGGTLLQTAKFVLPVTVLSGKTLRFLSGQLSVAFGSVPDGYWEGGNQIPSPDTRLELNAQFDIVILPAEYPAYDLTPVPNISLAADF